MTFIRRKALETDIIQATASLKPSKRSINWLEADKISVFIQAWHQLLGYYQHQPDDLVEYIHYEVIQNYLKVTRILNSLLENHQHESAREFLNSLESVMDDLIAEGYAHLHRLEDSGSEAEDDITSERRLLEKQVVQTELSLKISADGNDLGSGETFRTFINAWHNLLLYVAKNPDKLAPYTHCDVVSVYLRTTRKLNDILQNPTLVNYHETAEDFLSGFEALFDDFITVGRQYSPKEIHAEPQFIHHPEAKNTKRVYIATTVPEEALETVLEAISAAGGGNIGHYTHCAFTHAGVGRFKPTDEATPHLGGIGRINAQPEWRIETFCDREIAKTVVEAIHRAHPYEQPVVYILPMLTVDDL